MKDIITENLHLMVIFSIKSVTWANNGKAIPHPRTHFLNRFWQLNLIPKINIFSWKQVHQLLLTTYKMRKTGLHNDCFFDIKLKKL